MEFRSYSDLADTVSRNIWRVPADVDLVVSIPRSGIIPATLIALARNLPMTDVEGLIEGRVISSGETRRFRDHPRRCDQFQHALVVDDSVLTGDSLQKVKHALRDARLPGRISFLAVYVTAKAMPLVDFHFEVCPLPRLFEWNYLHHAFLRHACIDLDGVIGLSPTAGGRGRPTQDRGSFCSSVPLVVPTARIGHLVTLRPERDRAALQEWLQRHHIRYNRLTLLDTDRSAPDAVALKATAFREDRGAKVFIERESAQAAEIARLAGKPVICVSEPRVYHPGRMALVTLQRRTHTFSHRVATWWRGFCHPFAHAEAAVIPARTVQLPSSKASAPAKAGIRPVATASSTPANAALTRGEV